MKKGYFDYLLPLFLVYCHVSLNNGILANFLLVGKSTMTNGVMKGVYLDLWFQRDVSS